MTKGRTIPANDYEKRRWAKRRRRGFAIAFVGLLALQVVLWSGVWQTPYARVLMHDVVATEAGFATRAPTGATAASADAVARKE